jgi:hypothetical protein
MFASHKDPLLNSKMMLGAVMDEIRLPVFPFAQQRCKVMPFRDRPCPMTQSLTGRSDINEYWFAQVKIFSYLRAIHWSCRTFPLVLSFGRLSPSERCNGPMFFNSLSSKPSRLRKETLLTYRLPMILPSSSATTTVGTMHSTEMSFGTGFEFRLRIFWIANT